MTAPIPTLFAFDSPAAATAALLSHISPLPPERIALSTSVGRILAELVSTDRPSPAFDHSAVDGFALRLSDLERAHVPVVGEVRIGREPPVLPDLPDGAAIKIVTGGPIPAGAELVIMREHVTEEPAAITLDRAKTTSLKPGSNIRRAGENAPKGATIANPGSQITPPLAGALAAVGAANPLVHRRVRVAILCTGDELVEPSATPSPWQIRDSNGIALLSLLAARPWLAVERLPRVNDDLAALTSAANEALDHHDALILTGGVSLGDRDFVPAVLSAIGAQTLFHKLPQRPGKPILAAIARDGKPILALPGNPVSVLVTARRFAFLALRKFAGFTDPAPSSPLLTLDNPDGKTIDLWWHRLVKLSPADPARASLLDPRGSGDLITAAHSDGFVEIPPNQSGPGPWPIYLWRD